MAHDRGRSGRKFILGRIVGARPRSYAASGYLAEAKAGVTTLDRTVSDAAGRFLLEIARDSLRALDLVDVLVTSPSGTGVGVERVSTLALDSPRILLFQAEKGASPTTREHLGPIRRFVANGQPDILVESSCTPVTLEWRVDRVSGDGTGSGIRLLANGEEILADLTLAGSYTVKSDETVTYTLVANNRPGSEPASASRTLTLKRLPTLAVCIDELGFKPAERVWVGVMTSCPSPADGILVQLVSSDVSKLMGGEVLIPPGSNWGTTWLSSGVGTGEVEVTGIASGYLQDAVRITTSGD